MANLPQAKLLRPESFERDGKKEMRKFAKEKFKELFGDDVESASQTKALGLLTEENCSYDVRLIWLVMIARLLFGSVQWGLIPCKPVVLIAIDELCCGIG